MNIFILGHLLADFVFQKDCDIEGKRKGIIRGNLKHILKVAVMYLISAVYFVIILEKRNIKTIFLVVLFIGVNLALHFILDMAKSKLQKKITKANLLLLFVDQLLHIVALIISFNLILKEFVQIEYQGESYIILLIFLIISTFVSSVFIREILDLFQLNTTPVVTNQKNDLYDSKNNVKLSSDQNREVIALDDSGIKIGMWIGIIERTIMFLSIYFNILGLLTIVVAFKTLTRYENIKKNPEYYIIGNLLSVLLVLISYGIFDVIV